MDILNFSAIDLSALIDKKELLPSEIIDETFRGIDTLDKKYNAFITTLHDSAMTEAIRADARAISGKRLSVFDGIPVAVKDNICTKGIKTTCGSKMLADYIPPYDATVITHLKNAGMIMVGKTNMDEFGMGSCSDTSYFGAVHNPFDLNKSAGGSSGGSAAAVASRIVPFALGSDTGGSVRQPASMCGVCGIKSTYGAVSRYGLVAYSSSFDQIGVISHNITDGAELMNIISGNDTLDSTYVGLQDGFTHSLSLPIKDKVIGIPKEYLDGNINGEVNEAFLNAVDTMKQLGCRVEYFSLDALKYVVPCYYIISNAEASTNLSRFDGVKYGYRTADFTDVNNMMVKSRSGGFGAEVKKRIMLGTFAITSENYEKYYKKAMQVRANLSSSFDRLFERYDAIMCPTSPSAAGPLGFKETDNTRMYLSDIYTVSANIAGLPALSVPCGFTSDGLPVGVQFMGRRFCDAKVISLAAEYQRVTDWHKRLPKGAI
ncbi:MAG: Asp-tRNA(Asn)/Glu-tRNA(Gln) amidotransferase subunit GatA [Clostridia bacterium]|nr:Asp-tRNA(Asn)/Glu-tRNA(Gln) amidotransferase subunit GatA [Clostridia bacterium]